MADLFDVSDEIFAKVQSTGFETLSPDEQVFHVIWSVEAEVNNGGFHQYFFNSAGDHASQTIVALEQIGASVCAELVRRACEIFPDATPSSDRFQRQEQLMALTQQDEDLLGDLDDEFYEYPDDIKGLLTKFWEAHGN